MRKDTKKKPSALSLQEWEREVFARRPGVKREYDALEPEFTVIRAALDATLKR